jgi:AraC family L-rhamnose operon regulatory protein RhaS
LSWIILDVGVRRPDEEWKWPEWLILSRRDLSELTGKLRLGENAVWTASTEIRVAFREISHCVSDWGDGLMESRLAVAVNRLLLGVHRVVVEQQMENLPELITPRYTVELFLRDLSENPASCSLPWTLQSMATHCGMGITSLSKFCGELVNNGPVAYLGMCRLEHAARGLRENQRTSITDIAMGAGFNSSQYFATAFQRRFGMPPRAYRLLTATDSQR